MSNKQVSINLNPRNKPEPDVMLLGRGFHVVYLSVPDQLGAPSAVESWNQLYEVLTTFARVLAPILPFLSESVYRNLVASVDAAAPDSVHLTAWPAPELAPRIGLWTTLTPHTPPACHPTSGNAHTDRKSVV